MNILLTSDDGIQSKGFKILSDAIRRKYAGAQIKVIMSESSKPGRGSSIVGCFEGEEEQVVDNTWIVRSNPMGVVLRAMTRPENYIQGFWDLVFSGVNAGANNGADIFLSGTVFPVLFAAHTFNVGGIAFSQLVKGELETGFNKDLEGDVNFDTAGTLIPDVLDMFQPEPGESFNVNFPLKLEPNKEFKTVRAAPYSFRYPVAGLMEHAKDPNNDIELMKQGHPTITRMQLAVNPPTELRY